MTSLQRLDPGRSDRGPYSGTPFTNVANGDATSIAYRLWCATELDAITDWGQLTNSRPAVRVTEACEDRRERCAGSAFRSGSWA